MPSATATLTITSKSTKAQLTEHITALNAQVLKQGFTIAALRERLAMSTQATLSYSEQPASVHQAYWSYVKATKAVQKAQGLRVVTYKTFAQWVAAQANASQVS